MKINQFSCEFHMPPALSGESEFNLPPYNKITPYLVDDYKLSPEEWMRSDHKSKSYFVPVKENMGMWLDFNQNSHMQKDVAIVISIQGINPITGLPCNDNKLEQYIDKCPKHNVKFQHDRYCKKCKYHWPKQNYLTTTTTTPGHLWIDGFRSIDGIVRQYILTAEKIRGVANNIINKDRTFSIGISFYISKEDKPNTFVWNNTQLASDHTFYSPVHIPVDWQIPKTNGTEYINICTSNYSKGLNSTLEAKSSGSGIAMAAGSVGSFAQAYCNSNVTCSNASIPGASIVEYDQTSSKKSKSLKLSKSLDNSEYATRSIKQEKRTSSNEPIIAKKLEIAAGAKIKQQIHDDNKDLSYWNNESEGTIYINYCSVEDAEKIINGDKITIEKDGFLNNIPVGN